jgi:hypothetical protein
LAAPVLRSELAQVVTFGYAQSSALDREAAKHLDRTLPTTSILTGESCMVQTHSPTFLFRPLALQLVEVVRTFIEA